MIYGALCRAARALGYHEAWTYTLPEETGVSLRAAGFREMGKTRAEEWDRPSRARSAAVRSDAKSGLAFSAATPLNVPPLGQRHWGTTYEVSVDGRRVYFPHATADQPPREFGVILNWTALVK